MTPTETPGNWDDFTALAVIVVLVATLVCIACVGLCLKLYTEFVKEKKYREP